MKKSYPTQLLRAVLLIGAIVRFTGATTQPAKPPAVGEKAPEFSLKTLDDQTVELSKLTSQGPVVVIMLRGWVGYQCPVCTKQVGEFLRRAKEFADRKARVVLVYPGKAEQLKE